MKKIAVVILNWNGSKLLEQFLPYICQHSPEATIYVADNASSDNSIAFIKQYYPEIKIIQNNQNYGYAKGYNIALQQVEEELYALVNSDIQVTPNWLPPIINLFENEPNTAIIQPKIKDFNNKEYFEYAGAAGGYIDKLGYPFCRGRIFDTLEKDTNQYNDNAVIFWASGACFFIRKKVFKLLDGFDTDFFAHQEEIDLCWRAFNKGYIAKYCGESVVYHVGGATLPTDSYKKTFLNFRNSLWMLVKNVPKNKLFLIIFMRLILDGIAAIRFLLQGKIKLVGAILLSHYYMYRYLYKFIKKREPKPNLQYYKTNSIVYTYFIKKNTIFLNL